MRQCKMISTGQVAGTILFSILLLIVSQNLAFNGGLLFTAVGLPAAIGNVAIAVLYVVFTYIGVWVLSRKLLHRTITVFRIPDIKGSKLRLKPVWAVTAILMPALVLGGFVLLGGRWENRTAGAGELGSLITGTVFFYGLAVGLVEEIIFRGMIMGVLEQKLGRTVAIILPSVLFAALHVVGTSFDLSSILQLLVSGSLVGILFSLITLESGSVLNSALIHGIWNMVMVGGFLHIGETIDPEVLYNFVPDTNAAPLTGGEFGAEASVIADAVYLLFLAVVIRRIKNQNIVRGEREV